MLAFERVLLIGIVLVHVLLVLARPATVLLHVVDVMVENLLLVQLLKFLDGELNVGDESIAS